MSAVVLVVHCAPDGGPGGSLHGPYELSPAWGSRFAKAVRGRL